MECYKNLTIQEIKNKINEIEDYLNSNESEFETDSYTLEENERAVYELKLLNKILEKKLK